MKKEVEKEAEEKTHSRLAMLGITLVILGIIFTSEGRLISYSFMGAGVLVSVVDMIRYLKYKLVEV